MKSIKIFFIALVLFACQDNLDLQKDPNQNSDSSLSNSKVTDANNGLVSQLTLSPYWYFFRQYPSSNLYYANSTDGVNWSGNQPFGNNAKTSRSPAAVFFQNKFYVIFKGNSTDVVYVTSSSNGTSWSTSSVIPNVETTNSPAAIVYNNRIYVFVSGQTNHYLYYFYSSDGISWSTPVPVSGVVQAISNDEPSAVLNANGGLEIYYVEDTDNHVLNRSAYITNPDGTLDWTGEYWLPINCETYVSSSRGFTGAVLNGDTHLILKGNSSSNIFVWEYGGGCGVLRSTTGNTTEKPSVVAYNGKLTVVCKGASSNSIYSLSSTDAINWTSASLAVGTTASGPALVVVP